MSVRLFACISETTCPSFTKVSDLGLTFTFIYGSVLPLRQCNMLCTSARGWRHVCP